MPSSEWFPGRCKAPPYDHDEMTASRVTRTIDNVTSDEHKTQLLRHTDDAGFHRPEQTVVTDRRTNIRDTDRHLGAKTSDVVAVNNCDSVYYNSGKIHGTVPNSNNDVNNENVDGVCDNFPSNRQRTKWLSLNNSDFQVLSDTQSLNLTSEIKTCSFGCQFPEVDATNAGVHVLPGEATKQSAHVLEVSGVRSIVDSTCHDTDQHSGGSTVVGHVPRMESNKPREITERKEVKYQTSNADRTRCSDDAFSGEPNKITDYCKEDGVRENADEIDNKQKTQKVSNDEVRKVEQRYGECTEREMIVEENGQPQCKHERQKILKAGDGYRGFSEDDHITVVDADGHKEPETDVTQRKIDGGNRDRSDDREVPCRSTTHDKQRGSRDKAEHGRSIEGVCSWGASEVGSGKHGRKLQSKRKKKQQKKNYYDKLTNLKTVNKKDGDTSSDDDEFNGGGRGEGGGATGGANNKRKRKNYPRMRAKTKDENLDDGGSDVTSHRKIHDHPDIHRKEHTGRSAKRRKTTATCKNKPKSDRHVKMTLKPSERVGSSNKQHRLEDRKGTIGRAKETKADKESSKEITIRNIAQDKNFLVCSSCTGTSDQTLVNRDNWKRKDGLR